MRRLLLALALIALAGFHGHAQSIHAANLLTSKLALNLNQTNTDNSVTVSAPKYIVRRIIFTNPSTSLGASASTVGVFTGAGGTGTTVVTATLLTGLSAASKFADLTVAVTADSLTSATLFLRNGVAHGSAATCDVYIYGDVLP